MKHVPMKRTAAVIFVVLCLWRYIATAVVGAQPGFSGAPSDFTQYYHAGQAVLEGRSPFRDSEFVYPPIVAFLIAPLAVFDYVTARWIWFVLSHVVLLSAAWIVWRITEGGESGRDWLALCCVVGVWAWGGAAEESLALGQIGPLLTFLLAIAYAQVRMRGIAIGTACALKYFPGMLAGAFLLERNRKAMIEFVASLVLLVTAPLIGLSASFPGARAPVNAKYWMGTPALLNWSVPAAVLRALDPPRGGKLPHDWEFGNMARNLQLARGPRLISVGVSIFVMGAGVLAVIWVCRGKIYPAQVPWMFAGLISLTLAASPICWTHYEILQYPGVAMLMAWAVRSRLWKIASVAITCAVLLYPLPVSILRAQYWSHGGWEGIAPWTVYFWGLVTPVASLVLFGLFLGVVKRFHFSR